MSTNKTKVIVFSLLIVIAIPILLYVYVVRPALDDQSKKKDELVRLQRQYETASQMIAANRHEQSESVVKLAKLRRSIPEQVYPELILRDLRLLEVTSGLSMQMYNIQPGDGPAGSSKGSDAKSDEASPDLSAWIKPVKVTTMVSGTYDQMARMLTEMETMDRLYQVDSVTYTTLVGDRVEVNTSKTKKQIECSITMVTYYAPDLAKLIEDAIEAPYRDGGTRDNPFY